MNILMPILLSAFAVFFFLPMIDGIQFHGNFIEAIGLGALFAIMHWAVSRFAVAASKLFAIGTFGLGLLLLVPIWMIGFWLLPAVALMLVAKVMPAFLTVLGWWPAFWGGLVMLVVQFMSGGISIGDESDKQQ